MWFIKINERAKLFEIFERLFYVDTQFEKIKEMIEGLIKEKRKEKPLINCLSRLNCFRSNPDTIKNFTATIEISNMDQIQYNKEFTDYIDTFGKKSYSRSIYKLWWDTGIVDTGIVDTGQNENLSEGKSKIINKYLKKLPRQSLFTYLNGLNVVFNVGFNKIEIPPINYTKGDLEKDTKTLLTTFSNDFLERIPAYEKLKIPVKTVKTVRWGDDEEKIINRIEYNWDWYENLVSSESDLNLSENSGSSEHPSQ